MDVGEQSASVAIPRMRKNRSRLIFVGSMLRGMVEVKGGAVLDAEEESAPPLMASSSGSRSVGGSIPSKPGKESKTRGVLLNVDNQIFGEG